jgi:uncharacterized protein (TIGR02996 family)
MSREEDALLRAVRDEPEDAPRLVYADWLEEHGQPHRAEFIRVQCELAKLDAAGGRRANFVPVELFGFTCLWHVGPGGEPRRRELEEREEELLRGHGAGWVRPFKRLAREGTFRRGFLEEVTVTVPQFVRHAGALFAHAPVRRVKVEEVRDRVAELAACPHLARAYSLDLLARRVGDAIGDAGAEVLAGSPHLSGVVELHLGSNDLGPRSARALARSPHLGGLKLLDFSRNAIGDAGLRALARSRSFPSLSTLRLLGCKVGDGGIAALANSPHFPRLARLDLSHNRIGEAGIDALARSPYLKELSWLAVNSNAFDRRRQPCKALQKRFGGAVRWTYQDRFR